MTEIKIPKSVLVDTTFLINLTSKKKDNYSNARDYLLELQAVRTIFYLSALVIAEFSVKGDIDNVLALLQPQTISFDSRDAKEYSRLVRLHPGVFNFKTPEKERVIVDLMLVSQASVRQIEAVIAEDTALCSLYTTGTVVQGIDIKTPYADFIAGQTPLYGSKGLN